MKYLRGIIALAISAGFNGEQAFGQSTCSPVCPTVNVVPPYQPSLPVVIGSGLGHNVGYNWDNSPENPTDEGYDAPDVQNPNPAQAAECALLAQAGLPEGCSRQLLQTPFPIPQLSNPWQMAAASTIFAWTTMESFEPPARQALALCYADIANDPGFCEDQYLNSMANVCQYTWGENDRMPPWSSRELCDQAIADLRQRNFVVSRNRMFAGWFGPSVGTIRLGPFGVNVNWFQSWLIPDAYNQGLLAARAYRNCELIIGVWDENNCGT